MIRGGPASRVHGSASRVLAMARRDLAAQFSTPAAAIFLAAFGALAGWLFFFMGEFFAVGRAEARFLFDLAPFLLLFFVPAASMRSIAEEEREGTMELLLSSSATEVEIIIGKFLAVMAISVLALAATFPIPLVTLILGEPETGVILGGYMGALVLAASMAGIGIWASSTVRSQVGAFVVAGILSLLFLLIDAGPVVRLLPGGLGEILGDLSLRTRYEAMGRGVAELRDIVFLVSFSAFFLVLSILNLRAKRGERKDESRRDRRIFAALLLGILTAVSGIASRTGARLDLTEDSRYTLSNVTRETLERLDRPVVAKVYLSEATLPPEFSDLPGRIEDVLADLAGASGGFLRAEYLDPSEDDGARMEAESNGIRPVAQNVISNDRFEQVATYRGIVLLSGEKKEVIPIINPETLEYDITRAMRRILDWEKPVVAFLSAPRGEGPSIWREYGTVRTILEEDYEVREISTDEIVDGDLDEVSLLVVTRPSAVREEDWGLVDDLLLRGGNLILFGDADPSASSASAGRIIGRYGAIFDTGCVVDAQCEAVTIPRGMGRFRVMVSVQFPAFVRASQATISTVSPVTSGITTFLAPWSSPIVPTGGISSSALVSSSAFSDIEEFPPSLSDEDYEIPQEKGETIPLALLVTGPIPLGDSEASGDVLYIGAGRFVSDNLFTDPEWMMSNLLFFLNSVEYLTSGGEMIALRGRGGGERLFTHQPGAIERNILKAMGVLGPIIFVVLLQLIFRLLPSLWRRIS